MARRYARERAVPYFGICLGMQIAVHRIRAQRWRACAGPTRPSSRPTPAHPGHRPSARAANIVDKGATMRLGAWPCILRPGTRAEAAYGANEISERHRHRYEVNNDYRDRLVAAGLFISGASPDEQLSR